MPDRNEAHTALVNEIQLALGSHPDVKAFKNAAGVLKVRDRYIRYGLATGVSDIVGFKSELILPRGAVSGGHGLRVAVFFAIEVKTGKAIPTEKQSSFINVVLESGGYAGVARSVEDAWKIIKLK